MTANLHSNSVWSPVILSFMDCVSSTWSSQEDSAFPQEDMVSRQYSLSTRSVTVTLLEPSHCIFSSFLLCDCIHILVYVFLCVFVCVCMFVCVRACMWCWGLQWGYPRYGVPIFSQTFSQHCGTLPSPNSSILATPPTTILAWMRFIMPQEELSSWQSADGWPLLGRYCQWEEHCYQITIACC